MTPRLLADLLRLAAELDDVLADGFALFHFSWPNKAYFRWTVMCSLAAILRRM